MNSFYCVISLSLCDKLDHGYEVGRVVCLKGECLDVLFCYIQHENKVKTQQVLYFDAFYIFRQVC